MAVFFSVLTQYIWKRMDQRIGCGLRTAAPSAGALWKRIDRLSGRKYVLLIWAALIVLQLPVFFAEYPGFFCYDARDELNEVLNNAYTTHHPLLHVLLLGKTITFLHTLTGSWNAGIAAYIFVQMLVMTAVFAYVIAFLRKSGAGRWLRIVSLLFFGLFPVIVMYTLCSTKDGLFSAFLLLFVVKLIELSKDPQSFLCSKKDMCILVLAATLLCLFRHNGYYAYLVFIPFAVVGLRKYWKRMLLLLLLPVFLYTAVNSGMTKALHADQSEHQEMLTVSIMQLARTWRYSPEDFSEEDKEVLFSYLPETALSSYEIRVSDYMKSFFNNEAYAEDPGAYWKLWLKMLRTHPAAYLNAWLLTSYGYWYPFAIFNSYKGHQVFSLTYEDSSYFEYEVEPPGERSTGSSLIDRFYYRLSLTSFQQTVPAVSLLFAPGFYFWLWCFCGLYCIRRHRTVMLLPLLPVLLVFLTVLLGPVYVIRYVIILWYITPLLPLFLGEVRALPRNALPDDSPL